MEKVRKWSSIFILFLLLAAADAWLFFSLSQRTVQKAEDVLDAVWEDITYFPIPESAYDKNRFGVSFTDSWMDSRKFGDRKSVV